MVFDMSSYDANKNNNPRIGIAWKNTLMDLVKEQYDSSYKYFDP
jgi:hypothetical protein